MQFCENNTYSYIYTWEIKQIEEPIMSDFSNTVLYIGFQVTRGSRDLHPVQLSKGH